MQFCVAHTTHRSIWFLFSETEIKRAALARKNTSIRYGFLSLTEFYDRFPYEINLNGLDAWNTTHTSHSQSHRRMWCVLVFGRYRDERYASKEFGTQQSHTHTHNALAHNGTRVKRKMEKKYEEQWKKKSVVYCLSFWIGYFAVYILYTQNITESTSAVCPCTVPYTYTLSRVNTSNWKRIGWTAATGNASLPLEYWKYFVNEWTSIPSYNTRRVNRLHSHFPFATGWIDSIHC